MQWTGQAPVAAYVARMKRTARRTSGPAESADATTERNGFVPLRVVADHAGVSPMTVSRTINRDPRVSAETVKAVTAAMKALGFVPRPISDGRRSASRARRGLHTGRIALLFPGTSMAALQTALSARLIDGIDRRVTDHHLQLIVTRLPEADRLPDFLNPRHVDGVLVRNSQSWQQARLTGVPSVLMFEHAGAITADAVMPDSKAIAILAAERLLARGCRSALFIDDMADNPAHQQRRKAFVTQLQRRNVSVQYVPVSVGDLAACQRSISAAIQAHHSDAVGIFLPGTGLVVTVTCRVIVALPAATTKPAVVACSHDRDLIAALPMHIDNIDIGAEAVGAQAVDLLVERIAAPATPRRTVLVAPTISPLE